MKNMDVKGILFAREPAPGLVKTRLAKVIGENAACEIYRAMAEDTWGTMLSAGLYCWLSTDTEKEWLPGTEKQILQTEGCLGERIKSAFNEMAALEIGAVIAFGADTPHINPEIISRAAGILANRKVDVVTSPSEDGGIVLLGMILPPPIDLVSLPFETGDLNSAFDNPGSGIHHRRLTPGSYDIDDIEDLKRLYSECLHGKCRAVQTFAAIQKHIGEI